VGSGSPVIAIAQKLVGQSKSLLTEATDAGLC
jgi:hypothetical protein